MSAIDWGVIILGLTIGGLVAYVYKNKLAGGVK
jgi:hypothetical protein